MRKFIAMALVSAAAAVGLTVGAGTAEAGIEQGRYRAQMLTYGVVPSPISNARIIGNTYYQDYYGVGPRNTFTYQLIPTRRGMIASYTKDPISTWYYRVEYRKTSYGYKGVIYNVGGIPMGDMVLRKVRARR